GLQLYWLKHARPELYKGIKHTLHFPQYLSYVLTGKMVSEPTSIGCHTKLWDFEKKSYHNWVIAEGFKDLFTEVVPTTISFAVTRYRKTLLVEVVLHDSVSAFVSYLIMASEPFFLVSTGPRSISMYPFTRERLTPVELERDCLNYLPIHGDP